MARATAYVTYDDNGDVYDLFITKLDMGEVLNIFKKNPPNKNINERICNFILEFTSPYTEDSIYRSFNVSPVYCDSLSLIESIYEVIRDLMESEEDFVEIVMLIKCLRELTFKIKQEVFS